MGKLTRRQALRRVASYGVAAAIAPQLIAACGPAATPQPTASFPNTRWGEIQRQKTIKVGYAEEQPYGYLDPQGLLVGQDPETLRAIMAMYGVTTLEPVKVDFAGLVAGVQARRFDVMAGHSNITAERCAQVAFAEPNAVNLHVLVVAKGNPLNIHSFDDVVKNPAIRVAGQRGGVSRNWWINFYKLPESRLTEYPDVPGLMAALAAGRQDVAAGGAISFRRASSQQADKLEIAEPFTHPVGPDGKTLVSYSSAAFHKEDTDLAAAYSAGLKKLIDNGELLKIVNKYDFRQTDADMKLLTSKTTAQVCAGQ